MCREELSLKNSSVQKHITSVKQAEKKAARREKRDMDIIEALKQYGSMFIHQVKIYLRIMRVYHVKVLRTFMNAGIPSNKIDDLRDMLEELAFRLTRRNPMSDIPFVLSKEKGNSKLKSMAYM